MLKEFLQLDYRKLSAVLADAQEWTATIGLEEVPHFTTFQKAAQRLLLAAGIDVRTRRNGGVTPGDGRSPLASVPEIATTR